MSTLNVNTIVDATGSGGTNVKVANNSTYVSDGGSVTQNTVQGLVKAWSHFQGGGTEAHVDSNNFDVSTIDDDATGDFGVHFINNMSNVTYAVVNGMDDDGVSSAIVGIDTTNGTMATGGFDFETFYVTAGDNRTNYDYYNCYIAVIGDLA